MCYLPKSITVITLVRRINFASYTIIVSGSESGHSRVEKLPIIMILKVMAGVDTISFTSKSEVVLNIAKYLAGSDPKGFQEFFQQDSFSFFPMSDMLPG